MSPGIVVNTWVHGCRRPVWTPWARAGIFDRTWTCRCRQCGRTMTRPGTLQIWELPRLRTKPGLGRVTYGRPQASLKQSANVPPPAAARRWAAQQGERLAKASRVGASRDFARRHAEDLCSAPGERCKRPPVDGANWCEFHIARAFEIAEAPPAPPG